MIEVAMGYRDLRNWREYHERVEALQRAGLVFGVDNVSTTPRWLANITRTVTDHERATVLLVKVGDGDWRPLVVTDLATYEQLTHSGYESTVNEELTDPKPEQEC